MMRVLSLLWFALTALSPAQTHGQCLGDLNDDNRVTIGELIATAKNALDGCPEIRPRFVDNNDGTISDHATGLLWEKKQDLDGMPNLLDPHDADNQYSWSEQHDGVPNGSLYTAFLPALNACTSADGVSVTGGLAGYCDWRLPTIAELRTIVADGGPCIGQPPNGCAFPDLGPVGIASFMWSSTSCHDFADYAWDLSPYDGSVGADPKIYANYVRAVRKSP
jgi:hypothetical protein